MGIADTKSEVPVYLLMMEEVGGIRKLPILISELEAQSILIALKKHVTERPLTHELMVKMMRDLGARMVEVYINKIEDEVFYSNIVLEDLAGVRLDIDSRTSDAIALALREDVPIYVDEDILIGVQDRIVVKHTDKAPLDIITDEELDERMDKAILNEDYEMAARVRDEKKRRSAERSQ